jgi:hypothetical protein
MPIFNFEFEGESKVDETNIFLVFKNINRVEGPAFLSL